MLFALYSQDGCPTWIRTTTKGSKDLCATITPSDKYSPGRKNHDIEPLLLFGVLLETTTECKRMQEFEMPDKATTRCRLVGARPSGRFSVSETTILDLSESCWTSGIEAP